MDEDRLVSAVSLPMWFPAVKIDGHQYIDAVFATDANLDEAIRRGADELWIIWTVSVLGRWRSGFVAEYFQIIEASANSSLRDPLRRIAENNAAVARGESGAFGRHVEVKMLQAEVPIHYLFNFTRRRMARGVDLGVQVARRWCAEQGIPLRVAG
jgi:predicted acylesterase/phospholipase RssA